MKNTEFSDFQHSEDEKLWNRIKPMNSWKPNTDLAWNKLSMQLVTVVTTSAVATTATTKALAKLTLKKILIWSAIGGSITAATIYRINHKDSKKQTLQANKQPMVTNTILDSLAANPNIAQQSVETNRLSSLPDNSTLQKRATVESNTANNANGNQMKMTSANAPNSKILQFKQTELAVVAQILSQTFGVSVKIEKPQLLQCKLTATFDNEPLNAILIIIQETFNMEIVPEKETIWLKGGSCQ
jgi:hypothetical protein